MKIKYLSILALAFLASCQKDGLKVDEGGKSLDEISVSSQFDWKTTQDVNLSISINDSRFSGKQHVLKVYVGDPAKGGQIISKGSATLLTPFNTKIALPVVLQEVYVERVAPDGSKVIGAVKVGNKVSVAVSETNIIGTSTGNKYAASATNKAVLLASPVPAVEASPSCPSNPDFTITTGQGSYNFAAGKVYAITGNNISINNINEIKGKVYICGTNVTLGNAQLGSGAELYVLSGASVNFSNFNYNGNGNATFKNFGTITGLGNLSVKGVFYNTQELKINGTLYINNNSSVVNYGKLTVTENLTNAGTLNNYSVLTAQKNLNSNNGNPILLNTGTLNLSNNSTFTNEFTNEGTVNVSAGELNLNGAKIINASGAEIIAVNSKMNVSGTVANSGFIKIKELNNTGGGKIINNCKLWVLTNFNNDNLIENYSLIKVDGSSNLKGTVKLFNGAMLSTNYLQAADGIVEGIGTTSLLKVVTSSTENVSANGGVKFKGTFQYCDPSRTINPARFDGTAKQACDIYIPKSDCNDEGNGVDTTPTTKPDTDGDGVIDEEDEYPNDPNKAFNNYSINYNEGGSSVAFEDNWPLKGDYDMNDVVITYRYNVVTNAKNEVVEIKADYKLLASGGIFKNGAGVQFNIPRANAKNFKSTKSSYLEEGQDSVVVILFENSREEQATWNTDPLQPSSPIVDYSISFDVVNGPKLADFGIGVYNPFIWNNSQGYGRGYETHLMGKQPTNKANRALFGTADDNSATGKKYSTKDNLPWALEIPTAPFKYPKERIAITEAYLRFAQWAESGGTQYADWYTKFIPGYINADLLYNK